MFANPSTEEIRDMLKMVKTIAVVGYSPKADRPSHRIAHALQQFGYQVTAVRPLLAEALGGKAYGRLTELPQPPDLVDVFRAADAVDEIVDDCIASGVKRLWLQDGVINEAAAARARAAGITVVMDRCIWRDYKSFVA